MILQTETQKICIGNPIYYHLKFWPFLINYYSCSYSGRNVAHSTCNSSTGWKGLVYSPYQMCIEGIPFLLNIIYTHILYKHILYFIKYNVIKLRDNVVTRSLFSWRRRSSSFKRKSLRAILISRFLILKFRLPQINYNDVLRFTIEWKDLSFKRKMQRCRETWSVYSS